MAFQRNIPLARLAAAAVLAFAATLPWAAPAAAQNIVAAVNDDPITNVDVDQHEKMLRILRKPASPQAAMEDVVDTRLKLIETSKYKIAPGKPEISYALGIAARDLKTEPQQLAAALAHAGVSADQIEQKFKADAAWLMYVHALNRSLEVSENDVRNEIARRGNSKAEQYTVRQVMLVVPNGAGGGVIEDRVKSANALRGRFTDCVAGAQLVRQTQDAVIQQPINRSASALQPQLREMLDKTEVGHLTPPQRSAEGIEMLAVCSKSSGSDQDAMDVVRNDLLSKRLQSQSDQLLADVRKRAVIVKK